ncbi:hypothetical protein BA896_023275 [Janthinobacterium lividum]|uniref:Uncharacterized protein n=1 Tax=Janthinobacterium lividum TaxID=29581 RepID=A0A1E8PMN6_9BURK|nr:hypothetical protein BA896_023275 [Janthinobacterium lividum]
MQYDFNLPPGGALNLDVKGRFFKYRSGNGPIRVRASKGGYVDLMPGQGVWSLDYDSLTVQDRSGANNAGVLIAGDFDFHDDRIAGTVDVVDGGKNRTIAGQEFSMAQNSGAIPGQCASLQLWNAGTTKNIIISQIIFTSSVAGVQRIGWNTALIASAGAAGVSKKAGGSVSIGVSAGVGLVALPVGFSYLGQVNTAAGIPYTYKLTTPVIIPPGFGMVVQGAQVNTDLNCIFEYGEDSI